jgi:hypothetical protein
MPARLERYSLSPGRSQVHPCQELTTIAAESSCPVGNRRTQKEAAVDIAAARDETTTGVPVFGSAPRHVTTPDHHVGSAAAVRQAGQIPGGMAEVASDSPVGIGRSHEPDPEMGRHCKRPQIPVQVEVYPTVLAHPPARFDSAGTAMLHSANY